MASDDAVARAGTEIMDIESFAQDRRDGGGLAGLCINFDCSSRYTRAEASMRAAERKAEFDLLMGGSAGML